MSGTHAPQPAGVVLVDLWIRVHGDPIPQGSKTARVVAGRAVMWEANPKSRDWREAVAQAAWRASEGNCTPEPVAVSIWFYLPKPKSVRRKHATKTYDIDKLCRNVLDALGGAKSILGVIENDSQCIELLARKQWADDQTKPGAFIHLRTVN